MTKQVDDATLVEDSHVLVDRIGLWSFHDAEVVSLKLDRETTMLTLEIHVFRVTGDVDARDTTASIGTRSSGLSSTRSRP